MPALEDNLSRNRNPLLDNVTPLHRDVVDAPSNEIPFEGSTEPTDLVAYEVRHREEDGTVEEGISLSGLANGDVEAHFQLEFAKVLANIADLNTDAGVAREINIKIKMKPSKTRANMEMTTSVVSKLAPWKAIESSVMIEKDDHGQPIAAER